MPIQHGNVGCRLEVLEVLETVLSSDSPCSLCAFDFNGSGLSEGGTISLGLWESVDVATVVSTVQCSAVQCMPALSSSIPHTMMLHMLCTCSPQHWM